MKTHYRGHMITVERDVSMMGDSMIYFFVVRQEDGYIIEDSCTYAEGNSVREVLAGMKERVDAEIVEWEKVKTDAGKFLSASMAKYKENFNKDLALKAVFEYFRRHQKDKELLGHILRSLPIEEMTTEFIVSFGMASAAYIRNEQSRREFCTRVLSHFKNKKMNKKQVLGIFER